MKAQFTLCSNTPLKLFTFLYLLHIVGCYICLP